MKTEWVFPWQAYDFHFKKEHCFLGRFDGPVNEVPERHRGLEASIRVVPDSEPPPDRELEQTGELFVELPLWDKDAEALAYAAAQHVSEQIAFRNGDFRVSYGFVICKRIAENAEEEAEIDNKPYSIRFHLEEVVASPEFDGSAFKGELRGLNLDLLSQFNETRRDKNPVRQFLGYFRILESLSSREAGDSPLKAALRAYSPLKRHFLGLLPDQDFGAFVDAVVEVRHKCAHLKLAKDFGYSPVNPTVKDQLMPYLGLVEELAFRCIDDPEATA